MILKINIDKLSFLIGLTLAILLIVIALIMIIIREKDKKILIKKMAMIGVLSALSFVLYMIKFPLPFFVSFLDIQFSNVPVLIASFMFGPIEGMIVSIIRTLIKLPFSSTFGVGELQDLVTSCFIAFVAWLFYFKNKNKKNAKLGLIFSSLAWIIVAILFNYLFSIPFYIEYIFDGDSQPLVNMIGLVIPNVTQDNYMIKYLLLSCLPFNILLSALVSLITYFVYKSTSILFKGFIYKKESNED